MERETLEKLYAGLIGMDAGMRLGAPVENPFWTYERLQSYYGDIRGYLREQRYYTADDDVNGPLIFVRALADNAMPKTLAPGDGRGDVAQLHPPRHGHVLVGRRGCLHRTPRVYEPPPRAVKAPRSGSIEENGKTAAEQIGGQIFVDTWGLICPGDRRAPRISPPQPPSVSHGGSGVDGARFMAACVAAAYTASSLDEVLDAGLRFLPEKCDYRRVVEAVRAYHRSHPAEADFRACREMIAREFSDEEYPGGYHIVPNAGICILAMLYGKGELGRSIEISVMCGYDTDCNASNIGTILGVLGGSRRRTGALSPSDQRSCHALERVRLSQSRRSFRQGKGARRALLPDARRHAAGGYRLPEAGRAAYGLSVPRLDARARAVG